MTTTQQHPAPTVEQVRAAWDRVAAGFDEHVTPANMAFGERLLNRLGVERGTRVLDVACGSGALALPAARLGAEVVATDISPVMIERLRARARDGGLAVDARVMDAHALALDDDSFDLTVSLHGVSVLPDMARGLREMARVTRLGGRVCVAAFGPMAQAEFIAFVVAAVRTAVPGFEGLPTEPPPPFQVADPEVLRSRLSGAGLSEVAVEREVTEVRVGSAAALWDAFVSSNPIGAALVAGLDDAQATAAQEVLDRMLRERWDGTAAVLTTALNVGTGTV